MIQATTAITPSTIPAAFEPFGPSSFLPKTPRMIATTPKMGPQQQNPTMAQTNEAVDFTAIIILNLFVDFLPFFLNSNYNQIFVPILKVLFKEISRLSIGIIYIARMRWI